MDSFFDATGEERDELLDLLDRAKRQLAAEFRPDGFNIGINDGLAAGQTVPHLHIHLIPRYLGDLPEPRGGVRRVLPEKARSWESEMPGRDQLSVFELHQPKAVESPR